ncbi:hypothetical protein [Kaistia defluvii]|uniref:Uncharacterized protein n=1 Tax=Kaistia defluvii TaxID=410841 RepID=A0ABV2R148_9HYPH
MNMDTDSTTAAKGASAPSLVYVSDHLSEAAHLMEAIWMAAEAMMQSEEREAIRAVLHYASKLVKGARDDVDAVLGAQKAVAA